MSNVLITAASGHIGTRLVPLLITSPSIKTLLLPTRNPTNLSPIPPKSSKVHLAHGSLQDPQWVDHLLQSYHISTVFINLTGVDELFTTLNLLSSIRRSGSVKHVVYLSACGDYLFPTFRRTFLRESLCSHMQVKVLVEQMLEVARPREEAGGFSWTIIGPTLFVENDWWKKESILGGGIYPEPLEEVGVSRVSCEDIALGVCRAIEDQGRVWDRKKVMIGTLETYTGDDMAEIWTKELRKKVGARKASEEENNSLENHFQAGLGKSFARDMRLMYETFQKNMFNGKGFGMSEEEYEVQKQLLGKEPSNYEAFVKEQAAIWLAES